MRVLKWTAVAVLALLVALALFVAFGLNLLRGPISRAATQSTGRELRIDGDLKAVWSWVHPRFRAEKVSFANPQWAARPLMLSADAIEASIEVLPLFLGHVVVPEVRLERGKLDLEVDDQGRKNWVLDRQNQDKPSRVFVQRLTLDHGELAWSDAIHKFSLQAQLQSKAGGIDFSANGQYRGDPLRASGHAGSVLSLRDASAPFPLKGEATIGKTSVAVDGRIGQIVGLRGIDTRIRLEGPSMDDLYDIVHVALPATGPYHTSGHLVRDDAHLRYENFTGKVGESDLAGTLEVDTSGDRPFMKGDLRSKLLKLSDLGTLVGTKAPQKDKKGVLPDAPFNPQRWGSVNADVRIQAGRIERPEQLPIEDLSARIRMRDRVLTLDPLEFGIAGGKLVGPVKLDGRGDVIHASLDLRVKGLQLAKLFPTLKQNQGSTGQFSGLIELSGRGNSVGAMLGSANGKIGVYMDGGRISRLMMELVALDLWDAAKVKLEGDEPVPVRCAIADFAVKDGLMQTNALVFDTSVVNVQGGGVVNLKNEAMNLKLVPKPKDSSIASLNSPLYVSGTFGQPKVSPDVGKLAAKGIGAILLGIVNPVLAVLPLFKEGKAENSNCGALIAEATKKQGAESASTGASGKPGKAPDKPAKTPHG